MRKSSKSVGVFAKTENSTFLVDKKIKQKCRSVCKNLKFDFPCRQENQAKVLECLQKLKIKLSL